MELRPVYSSHIEGIGYDPDTAEAHIKFKTGQTVIYSDVSQDKFDTFAQSPSIGSAHHALFKNQHPFRYG